MQISAKTQYACIAILELARQFLSKEPVQIRRIADEHGIPSRFLVQILIQLRNAGLVQSTRGAAGGYRLARDPRMISLGEVMAAVEGAREASPNDTPQQSPALLLLGAAWEDAEAAQKRVLESVSFAELAEKLKNQVQSDYTI